LSALLAREADQRHHDWCSALESIKASLASLERTFEAASGKLSKNSSASAAEDSELVESIVAAAARERDAAVEQVKTETRGEIARLEGLEGRLRAEVLTEREHATAARAEAETLRAEREQAEAEIQEAKSETARIAAAFGTRLHEVEAELRHVEAERKKEQNVLVQLRREADSANAERTRLVAAVEAVQRALAFNEPATADRTPVVEELLVSANQPIEELDVRPPFDDAPSSEEPLDPGVSAQMDVLFVDIEQMYYADVDAKRQPAEVVDRLIANLHYAYSALCQSSRSGAPPALFERRMMSLVDAKGQTNFARHLSIAAYQWTQQHTPVR
jgi:hypothetical protein